MSLDDNADRNIPEVTYLELSDDQSHKFYEVTVNGTEVTIRYGRIGTQGQSSSTTYATVQKAQAEANKKINEKLKKGYVRIAAADELPTPQPPDAIDSTPNESGVNSRLIDFADLQAETDRAGRYVLRFPLERSLRAVEIMATCNVQTFTVNLDVATDIVYHFDVRALERQIVQNTSVAARWGGEERLPIPAEMAVGQPFTLKIAVESTLVVYLNGRVLIRYAHRLPPNQIDAVRLICQSGNLQVQSVHLFEQTDIAIERPESRTVAATEDREFRETANPSPQPPEPTPHASTTAPTLNLVRQPLSGYTFPPAVAQDHLRSASYPLGFTWSELSRCNLNIPLPRSLACLEMVATCNHFGTSSFTIQLCSRQGIAYRFDFRSDEGQIVQNAYGIGVQSCEESIPIPSSIASGQLFHLVLVVTADRNLVVYLNNQSFAYNPQHRLSVPLDVLQLGYDTRGLKLKLLRVLEPSEDETEGSPSSEVASSELSTEYSFQPSQVAESPETTIEPPQFLRELPPQFEPLRSVLEANLIPFIKIQVEDQVGSLDHFNGGIGDPLTVWQSKIGGNPYFPKDGEYPIDPGTGKAMQLLMQINCADVPPIAGFDFPQTGMLQFYLGFEPAEASGTPGKYKVLYFPEISMDENDLITDFSFVESLYTIQELYPEVYPITFAIGYDLFGESRPGEIEGIPTDLEDLYHAFDAWLWDYLHETETRIRGPKLGGYVDLHSDTDEIAEFANGRLFLELVHPSCCDDSFLFFIPDAQLSDRDFSDVDFYFVCD